MTHAARRSPLVPEPTLRRGSRGPQVRLLQDHLGFLRFGDTHPGRINGAFGRRTETCVRAMQEHLGLHVDGIYGPRSARGLENLLRALQPAKPPRAAPGELDRFIRGLDYDPRRVLAAPPAMEVIPAELPTERHEQPDGVIICTREKKDLTANFDESLVLSPLHDVVWPGAVVRADAQLVAGTPTLLRLDRAPLTLSVDLPGIGEHGVLVVDEPSHAMVQRALDKALEWWNGHAYQEGYVNAARTVYHRATSHSSRQLAASLGFNYDAASYDVSTTLATTSSWERQVAMALFKQVFYTVTVEPPDSPAAFFAPDVTRDELAAFLAPDAPPAYVGSVDYGRIIMLSIEADSSTFGLDATAALDSLSASVTATAEVRQLLERSNLRLITIGGNADVSIQAIDATDLDSLRAVIRGSAAVYSRSNPGVPIAYTVRFLKDYRHATFASTTEYVETRCTRYPYGWVEVKHSGAYIGKFFVDWVDDGLPQHWASGKQAAGYHHKVYLPPTATDVHVMAQSMTGLFGRWAWKDAFDERFPGPPNKTLTAKGTSLHPTGG